MEPSFFRNRLREMTTPEILDAIAEAKAGKPFDIYEHLDPGLIDRMTDAVADFTEAVERIVNGK